MIAQRYYFDTSIWLDLFEERDEPILKKSELARRMVAKIISEHGVIVYSNVVIDELLRLGYDIQDIRIALTPFRKILLFVNVDKSRFGKAKDLASKRNIPLLDAMHALIARDCRAALVTHDTHFNEIRDITACKKPEELM